MTNATAGPAGRKERIMARNLNSAVRPPTPDEYQALAELYSDAFDGVLETRSALLNCAISVFPRYCEDSPGYHGRVFVIVWPAGPQSISVATVNKSHRLERVDGKRIQYH